MSNKTPPSSYGLLPRKELLQIIVELEVQIDKLNDEVNDWMSKDSLINGDLHILCGKQEAVIDLRDNTITKLESQMTTQALTIAELMGSREPVIEKLQATIERVKTAINERPNKFWLGIEAIKKALKDSGVGDE